MLLLQFEPGKGSVSVAKYSGSHSHSLFQPHLMPSIVPNPIRERILDLWSLGALSSTQIAYLLEQEMQSLTGDPAVILKRYVESFCRSSGENVTCAPALKLIASSAPKHIVWAMDQNGREVTLCDVDSSKLLEIAFVSKDQQREARRESRQSQHMFDDALLAKAADNAVLLHQAKTTAARNNPQLHQM